MENKLIFIKDEETATFFPIDDPKLCTDDIYTYTTYPYQIEILKIDDEKNTVSFRYLNPIKNETEKTISINLY